MSVHVCVYMCACALICQCLWCLEEDVGAPERGDCAPPNNGTVNWTVVPRKRYQEFLTVDTLPVLVEILKKGILPNQNLISFFKSRASLYICVCGMCQSLTLNKGWVWRCVNTRAATGGIKCGTLFTSILGEMDRETTSLVYWVPTSTKTALTRVGVRKFRNMSK